MEGLNPTRRYKFFRPRQAARAHFQQSGSNNFSTIALYNNSTAAQVLVVRELQAFAQNGDFVAMSQISGKLGSLAVAGTQFFISDGALPGQLFADDDATQITPDFLWDGSANRAARWQHDFPFAVLEPNQSLVFQAFLATENLDVSLIWEAIFADQLDFAFEL